MSLPNLSSGNTSGDSDLMGRSLSDGDEPGSSSSAEEPGFRARSDFEIDSGLDGFASEENDSDASWRPLAPGRTSEGDAARPASSLRTEHEPAPDRRPPANVVSLASRGRAKIGTVVPRLIHTARLDRIGSTVVLVGQTGARVTHSLSATLVCSSSRSSRSPNCGGSRTGSRTPPNRSPRARVRCRRRLS